MGVGVPVGEDDAGKLGFRIKQKYWRPRQLTDLFACLDTAEAERTNDGRFLGFRFVTAESSASG